MDDDIDALFLDIKNEIIQIMKENSENADDCLDYFMIAKYLERIGDHASILEMLWALSTSPSTKASIDLCTISFAVFNISGICSTVL